MCAHLFSFANPPRSNDQVSVMNQVILSACVDVLVVEDDPNWVFFYRKIFERLGIACEVAMTIEDAEQKLDTGLFRYILCDGTGWDSVIRQPRSWMYRGDPKR
jgi:hypothetical protein